MLMRNIKGQKIIDSIFSGSLTGVKLGIDYTKKIRIPMEIDDILESVLASGG